MRSTHQGRRIGTSAAAAGLALLGAFAWLGACASSRPETSDVEQAEPTGEAVQASQTLGAHFDALLPWTGAATGVTLAPAGHEQVAQGPYALALAPDGLAMVLDRLAERVVRVDASGRISKVASVARDVEDIATGRDGSLVAWSPLRARAWLFAPDGSDAGQMHLPRELHMLQRLSIGPSMRLRAHTSYQQTMDLGGPSVPQPLAATLRSVRDGAETLPDGRGVACHVKRGIAELQLLKRSESPDGRTEVVARYPLPEGARAARVVGVDGPTVCMRIEHVTTTPTIVVDRQAYCLDADSGRVALDEPLGRPGLYLPRTELAVGGGRLGFMRPTEEGLQVTSWRLRAEPSEEVQP